MTIPCDGPMDADTLWEALLRKQPGLASFRGQVRLARNGEFTTETEHFIPGDEVALIPPVSGG